LLYADLADELKGLVGYVIHSSYELNGNITGAVHNMELTLGRYRVRITEYAYMYTYFPKVVLLYNPDAIRQV
jgi:hypothetical protein